MQGGALLHTIKHNYTIGAVSPNLYKCTGQLLGYRKKKILLCKVIGHNNIIVLGMAQYVKSDLRRLKYYFVAKILLHFHICPIQRTRPD